MSGINTKPKDQAELHATLEAVRVTLEELKANPADPSKHEVFARAAADIEAAKLHLDKIEKDAALALELAKDANRTPLGKVSAAGFGALKSLKAAVFGNKEPLADLKAMFRGNLSHMALMLASKEDLRGFGSDVVAVFDRFHYLNERLAVMDALMMGQDPRGVRAYLERGGVKTLPMHEEWVALTRQLSAAMDTAESGGGSEWVPTGVNMTLLPDVRPEHNTRNMITTYPMTRSPQLFPVQSTAFRGYLLTESTADHESGTRIGSRNVGTANVTFTAKKIGARTEYSRELLEDSIVSIAANVIVEHRYANGESMESALWNGQLTGMGGSAATSSTLDTGVTFVATTNVTDDRAAWDGYRQLYATGSCTTPGDAGAGLIADLFTDQFGQMGRFGYNPADTFIGTSFLGYAKLLVLKDSANQNVTLTSEKAGGSGTFQTGVLAQAFGRDVVASTQYPQTLNAAGVVDGSGTKTGFHIVSKRRSGLGEVRLLEIAASDQVAFDFDQIVVRSTWRGQMKPYVAPNSTTETSIGAIFNVG